LLESFRKGQRWLTLIFVSVIGLVFVFFFGVGGSFGPATPTGNAIVQLDDLRLTQRDYARERSNIEARLREQLGEQYDQIGADRIVASQALGSLINSVVLATAAEELGIEVTTDEVRRVVQASPGFIDDEGRFSPEAFNYFAEREYGTQRAFIRSFRRALLGQKLVQLLVSQTTISDAEIDLQTRYELDEVRLAYLALDETALPEGETISDEDALAWADENDAELREIFASRAEALSKPEQVRARHLLIRIPEDASDEDSAAARERAEAARERVVSEGEDFAAVASELSEDEATAPLGGDLGVFARGTNDPALDEAVFGLEVGEVSELVRSSYGFHVVQVEERIPARKPTYENERLALAREAATRERARTLAEARSQEIAEAIESGSSLEEAARDAGLTLERPPALKRRPDGFVPGLGAAADLLNTAFTLDSGDSSSEVFRVGDQRVLIQVLERNRPSEQDVVAERALRRPQALEQKQNATIETWLGDYRRQLEESGRLLINAELALQG
jgi:peptidyl-prolyl cis-trans isomerase D